MRIQIISILFILSSLMASGQTDSLLQKTNQLLSSDSTSSSSPISPLADSLDALRIPMLDEQRYEVRSSADTMRANIEALRAIPDSIFIQRLALLDRETPFSLDYNRHVHGSIISYLGRNKKLSAKVLGLAEMYFPMFEEALDREGLPLELKYLAIVESALKPTARSRAGATGLWQFMYGTGREMGLKITSYIDERKSPEKSTQAACKYLKQLYGMYGDWNLALAAYNSGPGNVNKAIRRAGGKNDYWEIWSYLPRETRGYVPAFIAVNYMMNYHTEHDILPVAPELTYGHVDTVIVHDAMRLEQIAHFVESDIEKLQWLNPEYHRNYVPKSKEGRALVLPISDVGAFINQLDSIKEYEPPKTETIAMKRRSQSVSNYYSTEGLVKETYTVRSGDVIGVIADRYNVGLSKLRYWNNIRGSRIYPGQKLVIYRKPGSSTASKTPTKQSQVQVPIDPKARYHTIRPGDTLWDIAKLYEGVSVNQIKQWNSHLNFKRLKPGQKVRVSG